MAATLKVDEIIERTPGEGVTVNGIIIPADLLTEAPIDSVPYVRKDAEWVESVNAIQMGAPFNYKYHQHLTRLVNSKGTYVDTGLEFGYTPMSLTSTVYVRVSAYMSAAGVTGTARYGLVHCLMPDGSTQGYTVIGRHLVASNAASAYSFATYSRTLEVPRLGDLSRLMVKLQMNASQASATITYEQGEMEFFEVETTGAYELVDRQASIDKALTKLEDRMKELTKDMKEVETASSIIQRECN